MKFLFVIIVISINFLNASSLNFAYTVEDVKKEFNSTCDTLKRVDFWDYDTGIKIPENYGVDDKREQQFLISILLNYANHDNFYNDKECGDILSGAIDHIIKLAINKQSEFAVFYILNSPVVNSQFRGFKDFHFFYYRNILFPIFMNYKNIDKHLSPNNFILKNYKDRICLYMNDNDTSSIINLAYKIDFDSNDSIQNYVEYFKIKEKGYSKLLVQEVEKDKECLKNLNRIYPIYQKYK